MMRPGSNLKRKYKKHLTFFRLFKGFQLSACYP
jgi:hypothetical protein